MADSDNSSQEHINSQTYVEQLTPQEHLALEIAKDHLKSSFVIEKTIGYIKWKEAQLSAPR